jgi:hypothetical protein
MKSKIGFVVLVFLIGPFAPGQIVRFVTHTQPDASVAWAQDASDTEQSEDVSPEPAVAPPDISGMWSGPIDDDTFGMATFTVDITQKGSKLKGDWMVSTGFSGTFTGKIESNGVSLTFKLKVKHDSKCKVTAKGTLESATEISGTYTSKKCADATSGSFDLSLP